MDSKQIEAIRARDQSPYMKATTGLSQSEEDRRALLSAYDALETNALRELADAQVAYVARGMELRDAEARLAEVEAEHAAFSNNVEQCEAENDTLRSRLAEESRRHTEQVVELVNLAEQCRVRLAEAECDKAEIMRLWFQDANPGETRFASLYAVFNGAADSAPAAQRGSLAGGCRCGSDGSPYAPCVCGGRKATDQP